VNESSAGVHGACRLRILAGRDGASVGVQSP
jgi:hypothetical protein